MNTTSLLICFDSETWQPTDFFLNGFTDVETARLQQIAENIMATIEGQNV